MTLVFLMCVGHQRGIASALVLALASSTALAAPPNEQSNIDGGAHGWTNADDSGAIGRLYMAQHRGAAVGNVERAVRIQVYVHVA